MARDSSGPKGEPQYDPTGAPSDAADLSEVATYAALVGNLKVLTSTARTALTGDGRWVGLYVEETDTGLLWKYTATGWVTIMPSTGDEDAVPTLATGWSTPSQNFITRRAGWAFLGFNAARSSNGAVGAVCVTIPAGFRSSRPMWDQAWGLAGANNTIQCYYDTAAHQIKINQAVNAPGAIALSMRWPVTS